MKTKLLPLIFAFAVFASNLLLPFAHVFTGSASADPVQVGVTLTGTSGSDSRKTYQCYATMHGQSYVPDLMASIVGPYVGGGAEAYKAVALGLLKDASKVTSGDVKATFDGAQDTSQTYNTISFSSNDEPSREACEKYMPVLIQNRANGGYIFSGVMYDESGKLKVIAGGVDTATPAAVTLPTMPFGNSNNLKFVLDGWKAEYFGTLGSGGGGGNTCPDGKFSKAGSGSDDGNAQTQACVNQYASTARFVDASTISFAGATFVADSWSGNSGDHPKNDSMRYVLRTPPPTDGDWAKGGNLSYIDIDTSQNISDSNGSGIGLNISNNDVGSFANNVNYAFDHPTNQVTAYFTNRNSFGDFSKNPSDGNRQIAFKTMISGIPTFARYYADDGSGKPVIQTVFLTGGDNEKPYVGNYVPATDSNLKGRFILADSGPPGCNNAGSKPYIDSIPADIANRAAGSGARASWQLSTGSDCSFKQAPIELVIMPKDAKPGDVDNAVPQCVNKDGLTAAVGDNGKCPDGYTLQNSTDDAAGSCEAGAGPLGWIMCALINTLADGVNGIYSGFIVPMLQAPSLTSNTTQGEKLKAAWASFRVFGNIFLVIVVLIVVFGESIGGGMLDAYTIKKILPRLLGAAIMINLSFYIVAGFIDISNVVGNGVRLLITGPFKLDGNSFNLGTFGSGASAAGGIAISAGAIAGVVAGVGAVASGAILYGFYVLLTSILIPLLFIFLAIMAVLALRLGLLYVLVLFAPVAFALWVLPNTEKYFKKWWELLQTTALVYPIISALFGVAMVLGQATLWAGGAKGGILALASYIISLIIVVMPLVLIPFAFKLAGGILGRAYDLANGQATKGIGAYSKWRKEKLDDKVKSGTLFTNPRGGAIRDSLNRRLQKGSFVGAAGMSLSQNKRNARMAVAQSQHERLHAQHALEQDEDVKNVVLDDDMLNASVHRDGSERAVREYLSQHASRKLAGPQLEQSVAAIMKAKSKLGNNTAAWNYAATMAQASTNTGWAGGAGEAGAWINKAAEGDDILRGHLLAAVKERTAAAGRPDIGGVSFTASWEELKALEKAGNNTSAIQAMNVSMATKALDAQGPGAILTARGTALENLSQAITDRVTVAHTAATGTAEYTDLQAATQALEVDTSDVRVAQNKKATAEVQLRDARAKVLQGGFATPSEQAEIDVALANQKSAEAEVERTTTKLQFTQSIFGDASKKFERTKEGRDYYQALASTSALHDIAGQVAPEKAKILADRTLDQVLTDPTTGEQKTIYQTAMGASHADAYQQLHKEFQTSYASQAQAQAAASAQGNVVQTPGSTFGPSDRRLKRNVAYIRTTANGIKVYRFQYLWSTVTYVGVMAQDLIESHPEALITNAAGYYHVNYDALGLEMLTLAQWEQQQAKIFQIS